MEAGAGRVASNIASKAPMISNNDSILIMSNMYAFVVGESKRSGERKESRGTVLKKEELNVEDDDEEDDYLKDLTLFDEDDADVDEYLAEQNDEEGRSGGGSDAWTVAEGQPVEVWDRGRLVLGNVLSLPVGEEASGHSSSSSSSSLGVLRVLVFEPSETVPDDSTSRPSAAQSSGGGGGEARAASAARSGERGPFAYFF